METKFLSSICTAPPTSFTNNRHNTRFRPQILHPIKAASDQTNSSSNATGEDTPNGSNNSSSNRKLGTLNIRYRSISKKQARLQKEMEERKQVVGDAKSPPKQWEEMTLGEKALELYVGEKGLLFWLNKFAYASIFIIIGTWILFRFVGPAFNLYQLDAPVLSPSSVLKGSS